MYNTRQCVSCLIAGVLLISLALCADAVIGNVQEKALKQHSASNIEMVLYSYAVGFVYILVGVLVSQSFLPAFLYCLKVYKLNITSNLMQEIGILRILVMFIYGAIDDLYQVGMGLGQGYVWE